jgi:ubiquinone/menaquinone biosynthesis C-methylase UbiE
VLDIACGTGTLALVVAEKHDCEVTGLDASSAMLAQAHKKAAHTQMSARVTFIQGDMRFLTDALPAETFDLVTCSYDSLNYLLTEADLLACFSSVAQVLVPGGLFVGDMNTRHFMEFDWNQCEIQEQPGYIQIEQSHFDPVQATSTLALTGFIGNDEEGYERFDETHIERAYPPETVIALLEQATLHIEASYNCFSLQPPSDTTQRILWVGRKPATHAGTDG